METPSSDKSELLDEKARSSRYHELKASLHQKIIEDIDLDMLDRLKEESGRDKLGHLLGDLLLQQKSPLLKSERDQLVGEVLDEVFGLGPIDALLRDLTITDILINGPDQVYVKRHGVLERSDIHFNDDNHLRRIIDRTVSRVGRRVDESSPMVEACLPDGTRVNVILPPLSLTGPVVKITRFSAGRFRAADLIETNVLSQEMLDFLKALVQKKLNILISGGSGTGKTALLNVLSSFVSEDELMVTIENTAELLLNQARVVSLESRLPNIEGRGAVSQRQLFANALRMQFDRIIVGEIRGDEAFEMLQAMNWGLRGVLTTINANAPGHALSRLEIMASTAAPQISDRSIRKQIASAFQTIVQLAQLPDGSRKVVSISEISGLSGEEINTRALMVFEAKSNSQNGKILGVFRATDEKSGFDDR